MAEPTQYVKEKPNPSRNNLEDFVSVVNQTDVNNTIPTVCNINGWQGPTAITFQFKKSHCGKQPTLTECKSILKAFKRAVDKHSYGNAYRRYNKRCRFIGVWEHTDDVGYHCHAVIDKPAYMTNEDFKLLLRWTWCKFLISETIDIESEDVNWGWVKYMSKRRQKLVFAEFIDAIDLETFYNPL
jgi:hypothetical protein